MAAIAASAKEEDLTTVGPVADDATQLHVPAYAESPERVSGRTRRDMRRLRRRTASPRNGIEGSEVLLRALSFTPLPSVYSASDPAATFGQDRRMAG